MSGCGGCSYRGASTAVESTYVGVRFAAETNLTLCATHGQIFSSGDRVVVEIEGEPTFARAEKSPMTVFKPCQKAGAKKILRAANNDDQVAQERKLERE